MDHGGGRRGSVLVTVLAAVAVAAVLGWAFTRFALRASRTSAWGRDHLALRLVAESATEEIFLRLGQAANAPAAKAFPALRDLPDAGGPLRLDDLGLTPACLLADVAARQAALGGPVSLECSALVHKVMPLSQEPAERAGLVRVECRATLVRGPLRVTERVRIDRTFRTARVTPSAPLDGVSLFVALPRASGLTNLPSSQPAFASGSGAPRTLLELLTLPPPEGLRPVPVPSLQAAIAAARAFGSAALAARAQYVTRTAAELGQFISSRLGAGRPLHGALHNLSTEPLRLAFPAFRGRCLISSAGTIHVGDVGLVDPTRDRLTVAAGQRLLVEGRTVQAELVQLSNPEEGVVFAERALVTGGVLGSRFPTGVKLGEDGLGACRVGRAPVGAAERDGLYLVVALAPYPASVEHAREGEAWSAW